MWDQDWAQLSYCWTQGSGICLPPSGLEQVARPLSLGCLSGVTWLLSWHGGIRGPGGGQVSSSTREGSTGLSIRLLFHCAPTHWSTPVNLSQPPALLLPPAPPKPHQPRSLCDGPPRTLVFKTKQNQPVWWRKT